jgi:succinate dehydrogenase/fumarate reductase flavoprotein subunit
MEDVQVHPTGFVDPKYPDHETKTLCAEILRGVGGILIDKTGNRFCNELGTRSYVVSKMLERQPEDPKFTILLNSKAAHEADTHISLYTRKGLLNQFDSIEELSSTLGVSSDILLNTFNEYNKAASQKTDSFGKKRFWKYSI